MTAACLKAGEPDTLIVGDSSGSVTVFGRDARTQCFERRVVHAGVHSLVRQQCALCAHMRGHF